MNLRLPKDRDLKEVAVEIPDTLAAQELKPARTEGTDHTSSARSESLQSGTADVHRATIAELTCVESKYLLAVGHFPSRLFNIQ